MFKWLAAVIAAIVICVTFIPSAAAAGDVVVRVGIAGGKSAVPGANLENSVGSGYRFGFYDSQKTFIKLDSTDKTKISVVKNRNVYYDTKTGNYTDDASGAAVGAFSVELPTKYGSATEASLAASSMRANGQNAFMTYTTGVYTVRLNSYTSSADAKSAAANLGGTAVTGSTYCLTVVETGTSNILFQIDLGDSRGLGIMPSQGEVERPITWCKGYTYAGGFDYRRMDGNNVTVINMVGMEDYAKGVTSWEMGANWHVEALKAQAVCARSYAYTSFNKHGDSGYDVCTGVDCQAYHGTKLETDNSNSAVDQTAGQYVMYDGKVCGAYYYSSNGGSSENSENVWYEAVPYLRAVPDPYEDLDTSSNGRWQYTITNEMLTDILNSKGHANSGIVSMTAKYTEAGNVYSLTMTDSNGKTFTFSKENAKFILNSSKYNISMYSQRFSVNSGQMLSIIGADGNIVTRSDFGSITVKGAGGITSVLGSAVGIFIKSAGNALNSVPQVSNNGTYIINGTGWGHNVGMSQNGAKAMAGMGFTYDQILKYYFTGVYVGTLQ